ncbi:hypothetical protein E4U43_008251 [Claviceps pusilla]|uniref:Spherulin 4 n=1 Tax=Claviceps pusilla TaxID=123648 RepID=A0A9P7NC48_9HYPO|nr:hypothetical protein E4U43_008251 [Claviceps pusilla]
MRFFMSSLVVAAWTASASATGVLLPLYLYPSSKFNDGAANWQPVMAAASSSPSLPFLTIVNPYNGPGQTGQPGDADRNYITGVSQLNALRNVKTIGYVRTNYSAAPMQELKTNMSIWQSWSTYAAANISIHGIFLDEAAPNASYMTEAAFFARQLFGPWATVVCNFGTAAPEAYYDICDVVVAFESCLNCALGPQYRSRETIKANIPGGEQRRARGAVIVNGFAGRAFDGTVADEALLEKYAGDVKSEGVGWAYFCSGGYDDVRRRPATIGDVARGLR